MSALASVVYTARTSEGALAQFAESCRSWAEADAYAARLRGKQEARGLPVDARVEVESSSFVAVKFQVRFTALDSEGGQRKCGDPVDEIAEAHLECSQQLAFQEAHGLPQDAAIWWRTGTGEWQRWGGVR